MVTIVYPFRAKPAGAMQSNVSLIQCECGARYQRAERRLPIKDIGLFACEDCGTRLEIWSGRTVPIFRRIEDEEPKQRRA